MSEGDSRRPKVSICIPSYNNGELIGHAIEGALRQTFDDTEIIVVDNDSSDGSEKVVRSFEDRRIRFYKNNKNIGMTRNWNKCVSMASGEFMCLLCADDMHLPAFVERTTSMLQANPNLGFVHCAYKKINEKGEIIGEFKSDKDDMVERGSDFFERIVHGNFAMISAVMFRKKCFDRLGRFDETLAYAPDWEMLARISLHHDVGYLHEPLACYRYHPGNFTKTMKMSGMILNEAFKTIDRIADDLKAVDSIRSRSFDPPILKSEYATAMTGVRLDCGDPRRLRRSVAEEVAKDWRNVVDPRLAIPFVASYLGIHMALASVYPSKLAYGLLKRLLGRIDRLV